uniref:(California timema) hypothetical protein n=1 Tax=Timema californicum TaxID=61474 RepID=A0A7R9PFE5_TIMCA|nr:unnamed protein product [Timema californicum]
MSEEAVTKKRPGSEKQKGASANLQREDFGAGPTNLDCIEPGLWLGNVTAATDDAALEQRRIDHILTVDSCPLPRKIAMQRGIKTLFIQGTVISPAFPNRLSFLKPVWGRISRVFASRGPRRVIQSSLQTWSQVLITHFEPYITLTDTPREDLLSHFEDTYQFISEGQERGVVLVHW